MWNGFLNAAIIEMFRALPVSIMARSSLYTSGATLALTTGKAAFPAGAVEIYAITDATTDVDLLEVPSDTLGIMDKFPSVKPLRNVFCVDTAGRTIFVRPTYISSVNVDYISAPTTITDFTAEVTQIPSDYHRALAYLTAGIAYLQEEDIDQYEAFRKHAVDLAINYEENDGNINEAAKEPTSEEK